MLKIDRMEFPRKYNIPNWLKFAVLVMVVMGIMIYNCSQDKLAREIQISDVRITEFSRVHVEVHYSIYNATSSDRDIWLLLKVYDNRNEVLGSTLYMVNLKAGTRKTMLKIIDKLTRPLDKEEKPAGATLEVYKRKILS
jgi:hypothetical protein